MTLGSAIGPSPATLREKALNDAIDGLLRERGDTLAVLREVLEKVGGLIAEQARTADAQLAAAVAIESAVSTLASVARQAPPVVNVTVPEADVEAPVVNVTVPETQVTVQEAPDRPVRKVVHRDSNGLIDYIDEVPA
jgi:hypothetical protein